MESEWEVQALTWCAAVTMEDFSEANTVGQALNQPARNQRGQSAPSTSSSFPSSSFAMASSLDSVYHVEVELPMVCCSTVRTHFQSAAVVITS